MKKIITTTIALLAFSATNSLNAQVAIGKTNITNNSVLLEFGAETKGIILPSVPTVIGAVSGGTFVFNTTDKSVQVWEEKNNANTGGWTDLTEKNNGIPHGFSTAGTTDVSNGVIIGASASTKSGALVLESTTKAMVLPQVANPHLTMKGAIAGTMVYDTASDTFAVYDGANWNYWK